MQVIFTPRAVSHLETIYEYIASQANEPRADGFMQRIVSYCERFITFPQRGTRRDDLLPGLRTIGFERRVTIAFMVTPDVILIEGIHYGGQDYETTYDDE